jgi:hypothetical protein
MQSARENPAKEVSITCDAQIKTGESEKYTLFATRYFYDKYFSGLSGRKRRLIIK